MSIKYNEFGEVISVNGITTGHHIGAPMQDATPDYPEDNDAYCEEWWTVTNYNDENDNLQPEKGGGGGELDALIEGTLTEITSGVNKVASKTFYENPTLTKANFPNATLIENSAFWMCKALKSVYAPKVTDISDSAFYYSGIESVDFPSATHVGGSSFYGCDKLASVNLPLATSIGGGAFQNCNALKAASLPKANPIDVNAFRKCFYLEYIDLGSATDIKGYAFGDCQRLKTVILRSETVCSLTDSSTIFKNCDHLLGLLNYDHNPDALKDGYVYVPSALIEDYKASTNWATFAVQFRALEDYTVDGTITGELDPAKIG